MTVTIELKPGAGRVPRQEQHITGRKIRADALPEHVAFQVSGCEFSASCLRCPLERCRYETPGRSRRLRLTPRDRALRRRREEGEAIEALAVEYGLTRRSVFRILGGV
jgi:hypothetical protein